MIRSVVALDTDSSKVITILRTVTLEKVDHEGKMRSAWGRRYWCGVMNEALCL